MTALYETSSRFGDDDGGNADADDPALWISPTDTSCSVVVGTLKNGGLTVTDLRGRTLQDIAMPPSPGPGLAAGRFNNVDIVQRVVLGGRRVDLAVVTDRGRDQLRIYRVDQRGSAAGDQVLTDVTTQDPPLLFSDSVYQVEDQRTGYGLAVRADRGSGGPWVVVSRRSETRLGQFQLRPDGDVGLTARDGPPTWLRGRPVSHGGPVPVRRR